jgi:hypothetical protein
MKILSIGSAAIDGPEQVVLTITAKMDISLRDLQKTFESDPIDPLDVDMMHEFMPMLKKHLKLDPFQIESVQFRGVSQEDLTVVLKVRMELKEEIEDLDGLKKEYEELLKSKLNSQVGTSLEDARDGFLGSTPSK